MKFIFLISLLLLISWTGLAVPNDSVKRWQEDIEYYSEQLKSKHIQAFHTLPESDFDSMVHALKFDLPSLSEAAIETRLMKITSAIGDGHTSYFMMSGPHKHYPLRFKFFEEKLMIIASTIEYEHLIGSELISINDLTVPELYELIGDYLPGVDNKYSQQIRFEFYLTLEKLLRGLQTVEKDQAAKFVTQTHGLYTTTEISPVSMRTFSGIKPIFKMVAPTKKWVDIDLHGIELGIINDDTAYFRFANYPLFEDVIEKCASLQDILKASEVTKLIVDFRGNGGGNFYSGLAFSACLQPLAQFNWLSGTAILTDAHTYSAAMTNTIQFKQIFNAVVIGEPTGGDPNTFSESYRFELPNAKRKLSLSIRYYSFLEAESDAVYPDFLAKTSWQNYQKGVDTVLLKALEIISN